PAPLTARFATGVSHALRSRNDRLGAVCSPNTLAHRGLLAEPRGPSPLQPPRRELLTPGTGHDPVPTSTAYRSLRSRSAPGAATSRSAPRRRKERLVVRQSARLVVATRLHQMLERLQVRQRLAAADPPVPLPADRTREPQLQQRVEIPVGRLQHLPEQLVD